MDVCVARRVQNRVVIASHDPFVFYYISFRTYAKTLFVNIYSNRTAISYRFPFISFFNEYCNATLLKRVQNLVIHDGYSSLLESTLATLSNRLLRPVSFYNTSFVFSFAEANSPLPYNKELSALLFKHGAGMGLQFHSDSSRCVFVFPVKSRAVYATVHTEYLHTNKTTQPAGLTLADDSTATPSPLPMRGKSEEAKKLVIAVEGIDFVVVFFLPEKMTFLVVLQACDETKDPARVKREVEGIVEEWTTDFFHQIRDVSLHDCAYVVVVHQHFLRPNPCGHESQSSRSSSVRRPPPAAPSVLPLQRPVCVARVRARAGVLHPCHSLCGEEARAVSGSQAIRNRGVET